MFVFSSLLVTFFPIFLSYKIIEDIGSAGGSYPSQGTSSPRLFIENKYYTCTVVLRKFASLKEAIVCNNQKNGEQVGAVIFKISAESLDICCMKKCLTAWDVDTSVSLLTFDCIVSFELF